MRLEYDDDGKKFREGAKNEKIELIKFLYTIFTIPIARLYIRYKFSTTPS